MSSEFEIPIPIALAIHTLALLALFISFWKLLTMKDKNYGFYMVAILHLAYLGYPIMNIVSIYWVHLEGWNTPPTPTMGTLAISFYVFSIQWTASNALFTFLLTKSIFAIQQFHFQKFIISSLAISLIVTISFPIL